MDPIDEIRTLIAPALKHLETKDTERIEKSFQRLKKQFDLQDGKLKRAIQDRQAVHALMKKTSEDLVRRYKTIFEQDGSPKIVIEKDGTIILANTNFCSMIRENRSDVENKRNICDYLDGNLCDPLVSTGRNDGDVTREGMSSGQIHTTEGEFIDVLINTGTFPESSQSIITFINVSDRIGLERQLLETSNFLSGILRASPVGFQMTDCDGRFVYTNEAWSTITGYSPTQILGKNYADFLHLDDRERIVKKVREAAAAGRPIQTETRIVKPDGAVRWVSSHVVPVNDADGRLTGWVGALSDITDRKIIESELEENRAYLETLVRSVQVGIIVIDSKNHTIIDANPAALAIIGLPKKDLAGRLCHGFLCPAENDKCPVTDLGRTIENAEQILINAKGEKIPIIKYVIPVTLHGRQCLLETFIDNTYRKKMEAALRESEEKYRAMTENTGDVIYSLDMRGILTYVSPQVNKYGYAIEEVGGKPIHSFIHPDDIETVKKSLAIELKTRAQGSSTFRIFGKDGSLHWLEGKSSLNLGQDGKPVGYLGILRDVTDRKRDEDAIELANKKLNLMNNVTRHDILNTITGVYGCIDMANATSSTEERALLLKDVKDLVGIIQRQINFTKQYQEVGIHLPQWQNVSSVIDHVLVNFTKAGLKFSIDLDLIEIYADPLLEKVFYNLIDNAIRYGTTLTAISIHYETSKTSLSIIFEDDGIGIPPEEKEHIFERGIGKNTGLGLFMTREILLITQIGIRENGIPGKGARFEISVPRDAYRFTIPPQNRENIS